MTKSNLLTLAFATSLFVATAQSAPTTLFSDDFNGTAGTALHGTMPDTTTGSATWKSYIDGTETNGFFANGSIVTPGATGSYLDFTPQAGQIYTLSATITTTTAEWLALGWVDATNQNSSFGAQGFAWVSVQRAGSGNAYDEGFSGATGYNAGGTWASARDLEIILDTRNAADVTWSASVTNNLSATTTIVTARSLGALEGGSGMNLAGFGFSSTTNAAGSIQSISLTVVPEPASFTLVAGLGALFLVARRKGHKV